MRAALINQYYDSPEYLTLLRKKVSELKEMDTDEFARAAKILDVYMALLGLQIASHHLTVQPL